MKTTNLSSVRETTKMDLETVMSEQYLGHFCTRLPQSNKYRRFSYGELKQTASKVEHLRTHKDTIPLLSTDRLQDTLIQALLSIDHYACAIQLWQYTTM